jgi:site-specific recombinase XerD
MFRPLYIEARRRGYADLIRAPKGDFSPTPVHYPERSAPKLDIIAAFETYSEKGGLKGGKFGPTAKRWRPKVEMFVDWLGHRDLARMTTDDGYSWMDHLTEQGFAKKSIRDVWIASLSATAGFMVERRRLAQNPFRGIKVRDVKEGKADDEKGFTGEQAKIILTATLAGRSHLISRETYAARRWVPWLCDYSGARVSEITALWPTDVVKLDGIRCIVIKPELEKTEKHRKAPIHKHVLEQGFLGYVDERRRKNSPLFYDPSRARGGKSGNPQWKRVGERLAEWIHTLGIDGPQPDHAWRHLFKSMARHVGMDREVEGFITGHSSGKTSADYGPRWTKTLAKEVAKYPRCRIAALAQPPAPHKRTRRTRAQIEADNATREALRGRRRAA